MCKCYLKLILFFLLPSISFAQQNSNHYFLSSSPNKFSFGNFFSGTKDFIELTYGVGELKHKSIETPFNSVSLTEIKFGRRTAKLKAGNDIVQFSDNYLFSSYVNDYENNNASKVLNISFQSWRFGLGYRKGFGYNFSSVTVLPYYQMGLVWNRSLLSHPSEIIRTFDGMFNQKEIELLNQYDELIKFGTTNIGGLDVRVSSVFTIGAAYETSIIFPYHKAWKQIGSFFIETLSQTGLDYLTEGVLIKTIPSLTPVIYFILKNGLSYYFYTLKQDEMNWPFNTPAPLTMEAFKFNLKVTL